MLDKLLEKRADVAADAYKFFDKSLDYGADLGSKGLDFVNRSFDKYPAETVGLGVGAAGLAGLGLSNLRANRRARLAKADTANIAAKLKTSEAALQAAQNKLKQVSSARAKPVGKAGLIGAGLMAGTTALMAANPFGVMDKPKEWLGLDAKSQYNKLVSNREKEEQARKILEIQHPEWFPKSNFGGKYGKNIGYGAGGAALGSLLGYTLGNDPMNPQAGINAALLGGAGGAALGAFIPELMGNSKEASANFIVDAIIKNQFSKRI